MEFRLRFSQQYLTIPARTQKMLSNCITNYLNMYRLLFILALLSYFFLFYILVLNPLLRQTLGTGKGCFIALTFIPSGPIKHCSHVVEWLIATHAHAHANMPHTYVHTHITQWCLENTERSNCFVLVFCTIYTQHTSQMPFACAAMLLQTVLV